MNLFNNGTLHVRALLSDDQKSKTNLQIAVRGSCTYSFEKDVSQIGNKDIYLSSNSGSGVTSINEILFNGVSSGSASISSSNFWFSWF